MVVSHARSWSEHCEKFDQSYTMILDLVNSRICPKPLHWWWRTGRTGWSTGPLFMPEVAKLSGGCL